MCVITLKKFALCFEKCACEQLVYFPYLPILYIQCSASGLTESGCGSRHFAEFGSRSRLLLNPDLIRVRERPWFWFYEIIFLKLQFKIFFFISKTGIHKCILLKPYTGLSSPFLGDFFGLPGSGFTDSTDSGFNPRIRNNAKK